MVRFQWVLHSVTLAKKSSPPELPQTLDDFPEEQGLHLVVPDSPPPQKLSSESPMVHTPKTIRAVHNIESEKQAVASPSHVETTGSKSKEPITAAPQRLPDSPFPKRVSPIPYHRPGTPYKKVDPPGREKEVLETRIFDKTDDSFEIDSESERTLTEESKETPKIKISGSEMPEGITKRRLAPVVLPFDVKTEKGPKTRPKVNPENPEISTGKDPENKSKEAEKPHVRPVPVRPDHIMPVLPHGKAATVPVVRSPSESPSESPVNTPTSSPTSPLVPVAMGMVEEIKNALIESNRVAVMPIPQFYRKKGGKPKDHIMKVEDYFQNYIIRDQEQNCNRFRDTCCGKARTWLSTLTEYPKVFDPEAVADEAQKAKTMKSMFLARWQLKDRTPQILYMEWQNLKFDPTKDDIEDFCNGVKNLANRLGYPEDAQVMAIKAMLPPVPVKQVINVKTFKEIRDTLITLVENPVIKRVFTHRWDW